MTTSLAESSGAVIFCQSGDVGFFVCLVFGLVFNDEKAWPFVVNFT